MYESFGTAYNSTCYGVFIQHKPPVAVLKHGAVIGRALIKLLVMYSSG